jgi:MOSC domain-containing protein YiiM
MDGRVLQVNISAGGVPKRPVDGPVAVGALGLEGDAHREDTVHGGPHRAVCLFGIEAIGRVAADGHPIFPGSCGENLTTEGIELSSLPVGTRLAIGERLVLELASPDGPCETIEQSFSDRRSSRINIDLHPTDSRMYARVIAEGAVRAGDPITVVAAAVDSRAEANLQLAWYEGAVRAYALADWGASVEAGMDLETVDDGELAMVACRSIPGRWRNRALGFDRLPNLLPRAIEFFDRHGVVGWMSVSPETATDLGLHDGPVDAGDRADIHVAPVDEVPDAAVAGVTIRQIGPDEAPAWVQAALLADDVDEAQRAWLPRLASHLLGTPRQAHRHLFVAEEASRVVGTAALFTRHRVGLLAAASVHPQARGRGIHRALVAARARAAADRRCAFVVADAEPGSSSARNQRAMGLRWLGSRVLVPVPRSQLTS